MLTEAVMARRRDWEKRRFDSRSKITIIEEQEFRDHDLAARWLQRAEEWQKRVGKQKRNRKRKKRQ
jgi:hypothetical protein